MKNKTLLITFGTRPEAIKLIPLIRTLKSSDNFELKVCVSAQHRQMLDSVLDEYEIVPDYDLDVMKERQSLDYLTSSIVTKTGEILDTLNPCAVIVHGDTTTAFCSALAAFYRHIPVVHIEAGLRTKNIFSPHPEEFNRRAISIIADYHFAPTKTAADTLIAEGTDKNRIFTVGNTAIDTLLYNLKCFTSEDIEDIRIEIDKKCVLITVHRREHSELELREIFEAIRTLCLRHPDVSAIYPLHKTPRIRELAKKYFDNIPNIALCEPLNTKDFHFLLSKAYMVLTDSGGIQEEAVALGIPTLVLRSVTERQEGIGHSLLLAGTNKEDILFSAERLLNDTVEYRRLSRASNVFGDGHASERIADILGKLL
ncbi:MAG: UDP-N-acetylglucosamine 2-epimerase (non-hydrolyzing) [Ruminococcaceae bacterium]|nr:UDP-N-acetylglucosamine 2-epimerase (non-hydrolyzing) [Oscillospiraceae bacterium]